jgi:predicted porin
MKNVLLIVGLAVLSTSAFASKARLEALGADTVYYIDDIRSIFSNPSDLNGTKNLLITEWGAATSAADSVAAPKAEGGFFRDSGTFTYGVYLGNNTQAANRTTGFQFQDNAIDLFLAGDAGLKWGAKLHYADRKDETGAAATQKKNSAMSVALGARKGDMSGYVNIDLTDKSTGNGTLASIESKLKPSYLVGGTYDINGFTVYVEYSASKLEETIASALTTYKDSYIVVGAGRMHEINPTSRFYSNVLLKMATEDDSAGSNAGKTKTNTLPVTIGMEADATSWLTLRGSISQNVVLGETKNPSGKKASISNSTAVNTGATLNFGKVKVDGMIGNTQVSRAGTVNTTDSKQGVLSTDNLLTRVGVSYAF